MPTSIDSRAETKRRSGDIGITIDDQYCDRLQGKATASRTSAEQAADAVIGVLKALRSDP